MLLKIGELAKRIGLTIRALHHYEDVGLVQPSARTSSGYRLYDRDDIARLHKIQALRGLGLSLAETRDMLNGEAADLRHVIRQQITSLDRQIAHAAELRGRLCTLETELVSEDEPDLNAWLSTLGLMATQRKYFTQEEINTLYERKERNDNRQQWPPLVEAVRELMCAQVPCSDPRAKEIARRWLDLSKQTMGDDPRFFAKLCTMHRTEFSVQTLTGVDGEMLDYICLASHEIRCDILTQYLNPDELQHYRTHCLQNSQNWLNIFAEARQMMENKFPPAHPDVLLLMRRWCALLETTYGKDPSIASKIRAAHLAHPELMDGSGFNQQMRNFVEQGMQALAAETDKTNSLCAQQR
jgi:DNA-binding transcriptional MerR regulator